jgi:hypothetical protein
MTIKSVWDSVVSWVVLQIGKVHWAPKNLIDQTELDKIRALLVKDYYIILTHRDNHLSTFFTEAANFFLTGKWGYWAHALMNTEDGVTADSDFRLEEAVSAGTKYTPFDEVFDVQGVVLMKPKSMTIEKWTAVLDKAKTELGKPYDTLFNLTQEQELSCVELVRAVLMAEPNYATDFANFEAMIVKYHTKLSPDMFYYCDDFEVVYEKRNK